MCVYIFFNQHNDGNRMDSGHMWQFSSGMLHTICTIKIKKNGGREGKGRRKILKVGLIASVKMLNTE